MRQDVAKVGSTRCRSTGNQVDDRTAHIRVVFNGGLIDTRKEIPSAAARRGPVRIKDRFAAIEFIENGCEGFVTEPLISPVAQQAHTFRFERIKRVFDLAQAGVDVRQGQHSEQAEPAFVVGNDARTVFVFPASKTPGLVDISEPDTGRGNRDHGSGYAAAIHVLDGSRRCVRLPGLVTLSLLRIHHRDPCG